MRLISPRIVVKTIRITAWPLLLLMLLFIASGYALAGKYGFHRMMNVETALSVHRLLDIPLIVLFVLHAFAGTYICFRRWGWIGRRARK